MIAPVPESVVSVTFDNLGEAAQLELGMWPADVPQGEHFSVVEVLPRLLELLATRNAATRGKFVVLLRHLATSLGDRLIWTPPVGDIWSHEYMQPLTNPTDHLC